MVSPRKNDYFNKQCPLYTDQGGILQGQLQRTMVWFLFTLILDLTQRYQDTFCVKLTPRIGRGGFERRPLHSMPWGFTVRTSV